VDLRGSVELNKSTRLLLALAPLYLSWLLMASMPIVLTSIRGWNPHGGWPEVPYLLTQHAAGEHVRSSVYYLIIVSAGGLISAMVIECSKVLLARQTTSLVPYIALLVHQAVTWLDAIRTNAYDWWMYLLHVAHLYRLDSSSWLILHPSLAGRWPWPAAISAIVMSAIIVVVHRAEGTRLNGVEGVGDVKVRHLES